MWSECQQNKILEDVKNAVCGEVSGEKGDEISGGVSTKHCFKIGRYLENKVEGQVRISHSSFSLRKGVKMMPKEYSGRKKEKKRLEGEEDTWRIQ